MRDFQWFVHAIEVGPGRILLRLLPLAIVVTGLIALYDLAVYRGLDDAQSMDNAQLARELARGGGYNTEFIRPAALAQLGARAATQAAKTGEDPELFPASRYPAGAPRLLPDTYNAPGYPYLLGVWYRLVSPNFAEPLAGMQARRLYAGDRPIPWLNQIFVLLTALLVFILGWRLCDGRVAWLALLSFLASDIVWRYSLTALSTSFLMFLVTAVLAAAAEIARHGERPDGAPPAGWPAWQGCGAIALLLGAACLTRLHLLVLLVPVAVFLLLTRRVPRLLVALMLLVVVGMVAPWLWHMARLSGSPLGSNGALFHAGVDPFKGNRIFCAFEPPPAAQPLRDAMEKETTGFGWHLAHAWVLLGENPLVLLYAASLLHHFRRRRVQALRWLILGALVALVAANNLGVATPEAIDAWNVAVLLLPGLLVIGAAFFFVLLDRLELEARALNVAVAAALLVLTAVPMAETMTAGGPLYNFPPYAPVYLRYLGQLVHPRDWITSDMPWATAWYSDRVSLWLPDTVRDFEKIHDDLCPSEALIFTPVTLDQPLRELETGEEKEWLPFLTGSSAPAAFPLPTRKDVPVIDYILWISQD